LIRVSRFFGISEKKNDPIGPNPHNSNPPIKSPKYTQFSTAERLQQVPEMGDIAEENRGKAHNEI